MADTRDEQAIEQAEPFEQAERANNPFQFNGPALQGSPAFEPYMIGNENDARQGIGQLPIGYDEDGGVENADGVSMGAVMSVDVGLNKGDAMEGLDSNAFPLFNDGVHPAPTGGVDAMRGLAPGTSLAPASTEDGRVLPDSDFTFPEPAE